MGKKRGNITSKKRYDFMRLLRCYDLVRFNTPYSFASNKHQLLWGKQNQPGAKTLQAGLLFVYKKGKAIAFRGKSHGDAG